MSRGLPEQVDVWRLVAGRFCFAGDLALSSLQRLRESLADAEGSVGFEIEFGTDELEQAYVELRIQGELPLVCQRTLEVYRQAVSINQRLGLIRREDEEAALPPGYEALLVPVSGLVAPADLVEDELILALPLVPARPDSVIVGEDVDTEAAPGPQRENPFSALKSLKFQ